MKTDNIREIKIDNSCRLCIYPQREEFTLVYRSATEVHWDGKGLFLYSPKPREWTYYDWFKHIISVIKEECGCNLLLTSASVWTNIPDALKYEITNGQESK